MTTMTKNWDDYVVHAEDVARGAGFAGLRDRILELADAQPGEVIVDVGSGTGLLTLPLAATAERVWAVDISAPMGEYLATKAASAGIHTIEVAAASAVSLPLVDECADLVVSNYCFHHLDDDGKDRALAECYRVLAPGGRLAFGDMMFRVSVTDPRDRRLIVDKTRSMLRRGPAGAVRVLKNAARYASRRWEYPARADWWQAALHRAGFIEVDVEILAHEGGLAFARKPL